MELKKDRKAETARKFFANPKIENEVFRQCVNYILQFAFQKYLMNSLFIGCENDEWCYFVVALSSVCFDLQRVFRFFLFVSFFSYFFVDSTTCRTTTLTIPKIKHQCSRFFGGVSRGELFQSYSVINVIFLVQFGKNLSYILPPLALQNYLLQSISVKLICQFLCLINGYCLCDQKEKRH